MQTKVIEQGHGF